MDKEQIVREMIYEGRNTTIANACRVTKGQRMILPIGPRRNEIVYYGYAKNAPMLFAIHGGGFLLGGCAIDDNLWCALRETLKVNIISIGYHKTPDHIYPQAVSDVYETITCIIKADESFLFDRNRVGVIGCSAGANLATVTAMKAKAEGHDYFKYQILIYPYVDLATPSVTKGDTGAHAISSQLYADLYLGKDPMASDNLADAGYVKDSQEVPDPRDPYISPVYANAGALKGLPKTLLSVCELDSFRGEGERYARHLMDAGVPVITHLSEGVGHAFFERFYADEEYSSEGHRLQKKDKKEAALETPSRKLLSFIQSNLIW